MQDNSETIKSIKDALDEIRSLADSKTIIGDPINIGGLTTIIPVSRVSIGLGLGGRNNLKEKNRIGNAGGATGLSVAPVAFLVIDPTGAVKLLNVGENTGYDALGILNTVNSVDQALDKAPDIIEKIKALFAKKDKSEDNDEGMTTSGSDENEQTSKE